MDSANIEESTSLTTSSPSRKVDQKSPRSMSPYNREKRILMIRLNYVYYISWIVLIILCLLIPPYLYLLMPKPECWEARKIHVNISLILAIVTSSLAFLLLIFQCFTRIKTNLFRKNFSRFAFTVFTLLTILHFIIAIYFFNMFSCYFDQSTPDEVIDDKNDWLTNLAIRYDLKIVAVIHLIISLLTFYTGIGFAVIKKNLKYALVVDIN